MFLKFQTKISIEVSQQGITHNDPRLCEGQGLELQIFNKPQKMIRNTNVDVTDKALPFAKPLLAVRSFSTK